MSGEEANNVNLSKTGLGQVHLQTTEVEIKSNENREKYIKYTPKDRYNTVKYASENDIIASVRKFKAKFLKLNQSTPHTFRQKWEPELSEVKRKGRFIDVKFVPKDGLSSTEGYNNKAPNTGRCCKRSNFTSSPLHCV